MPKTLLLADDSVTIQKVVGISFASEDITLLTVDNGDDAIARAKESKPDLILADVVMPGKNGYEVCEAVKADPELAHIPVLLLTGTFEAFDEERAANVGAAGHVAKPFEAQTLVDQVKRLLAEGPVPVSPRASTAPEPTAASDSVPPTAVDVQVVDAASLEPVPVGDPGRSLDPPPIEDAFDFFDDEVQEPSTPAASSGSAFGADLDIDSSESAFAFGEDEISPTAPPADRSAAPSLSDPPAGDRTVAILPDAPIPSAAPGSRPRGDAVAGFGDGDLTPLGSAALDSAPDSGGPGDSLGTLDPSPPAASDLDFDFEAPTPVPSTPPIDEPRVPVEAADLAQATILDPNGASGYDVSSSDLGDPLAIGPSPAPRSDLRPMSEPPAPATVEPTDISELPDLLESVDRVHADHTGLTAEPMRRPFSVAANPVEATDSTDPAWAEPEDLPAAIPEIAPEPMRDAEPLVGLEISALDTSESFASVSTEPEFDAARTSAAALEEITPKLRAQLHDTLEKIAWESFSDLTETIVRQAVDRVEKVAWEVIPELAETLVREEIRRMKGDDS
jgi:CheY-like chemotaxis protein